MFFWNVVGRERNRQIWGFRPNCLEWPPALTWLRSALVLWQQPWSITKVLNFEVWYRRNGAGQRTDKEIFIFQLRHQFLVLLGGKLAGGVSKMAFAVLADGVIKQNNGGHILRKGFCSAGDLLCQNSNAYDRMACWKAERNQLTCAAFHVLRDSAIVQNNKRISSLKK